jgi:hypothetical protein
MIAVIIALCCAGLAVVAFRREGGPVTFVGDDFRTLVAHETYTVDWATGTVADLATGSTVTDTTETTARWNPSADGGKGAYADFKTRTVGSTSSSAFSVVYDNRSLPVRLSVTTGSVICATYFKGIDGHRMTMIWLTKQGERRGHYWRFLNHTLRSYGIHPVADRTEAMLLSEPNWGALVAAIGGWAAVAALGWGVLYGIGGGITAAAVYIVKARAKHERRRGMYFSEMERFGRFIKAQQPLEIDQPPRDPSTCPDEESV